jgi:dipeptidyl aminopeptidase/acylaminoacyl peptidase
MGTLGHSLGAHTSLRVAVVNPNIKATVYAAGVVASTEDILYNWPNSPMPNDMPASIHAARDALLAQYGTPRTNPEFWNSVSAINYVSNITGASQIHHSQADAVVPIDFSIKLDNALKASGKPVEFYNYPGNDHQIISNSQLAISRIVSFFKNNL